MEYRNDTICAVSTPPGTSGIAVIRISGAKAIPTVQSIFKSNSDLSKAKSHSIHFGRIVDQGKVIDDVLISVFLAPHSYTGEDVIEISCHGNTFISGLIMELLLQKIRMAEPGEFTQRAFFNDKIGLTQSEAVGDLLHVQTRRSHQAAILQLEGNLRRRIEKILIRITEKRILLELEIDFQEQDLENLDPELLKLDLKEILQDLTALAESGREGMILREGLRVSLVGAPNVGKSSIFNAFLETERAIVTPHPGTTRDYLEEAVSLHGYLVRLFDTAGIRTTDDQLEQLGIDRSFEVISNSHLVLYITDSAELQKDYQELTEKVEPERIIRVLNKADLFSETQIRSFREQNYLICTTRQENGLDELKSNFLKEIEISDSELEAGILVNTRQIAAVKKAVIAIEKALETLENELGYEFIAFDLQEASNALEEVIGKITSEDVLTQIFADFCIGK